MTSRDKPKTKTEQQGALLISEARYRQLLSRMTAIVFELQPDGTILYVNDAVEQATGYSAQELLGQNWWETFFAGEQAGQGTALHAQLNQGDVSNFEIHLTTRSGSSITLELNTANRYGPDGTLEQVLGLGVDTTERRRTERSRRFLSEASLALASSLDYQTTLVRLAYLAVPTLADWCMVYMLTPDGSVEEVAITNIDKDKAAWVSEVARDYPPKPHTKSVVWRVIESGKAEVYPEITDAMIVEQALDARHLKFLREISFASLIVMPLVAHGRTIGAVQFVLSGPGRRFDSSDIAIAEELTARGSIAVNNSHLYLEAGKQRERLQITLSSMGDAVIATDAQGHVSFMNPVAQSLTGWRQSKAQGMALDQVFRIVNENSREPVESSFTKVMRGGKTVGLENHTVLIARDGRELYIDNNGAPIRDESGAIVGVILVFHDITEQRRAQFALRDSQQRFKAIFDQAAVGMTESNLDGQWTLANQSFCTMLGYSEQELINHTLVDFTHPDDLAEELENVRQLLAGECQSFSMEKRYFHKDGSTVWANVTSSSVLWDADNLNSYMSIVEDITKRKQMDAQVRFQAHMLDTVRQSIIATDLADNVIYWNRFAETLYGWSSAEAVEHNVAELVVSHRTSEQQADMLACLHNDESWTGEFSIQRRDGTVFPALVTNSPIYDANGRLDGIIRVSADITERMSAEQALKESEIAEREQRLLAEALLDSAAALTNILDPAVVMNRILENVGRVIVHDTADIMLIKGNTAYIAYWHGYPAELDGFLKKLRLPLDSPSVRRMLETGLPILIDDVTDDPGWVNLPETTWIRSYAGAPIRAHGEIIGFLNIVDAKPKRFSTLDAKGLQAFANQAAVAIENANLYVELRRYAAELEERVDLRTAELQIALEKERELGELKTRFISMASHEIRTPLAVIQISVDSLRLYWERMPQADRDKRFKLVKTQIEHMTGLLDDVLTIGRTQSSALEFHPTMLDLNSLCEEIVEQLRLGTQSHELGYVHSGDAVPVHGDPKLLRQAIGNLISNAIKYSPGKEHVDIRLVSEQGHVLLSVQDQGIGIPQQDQEYLFEPFHRSSNVGAISGTGLGLAIVKRAVDLHGGQITVNSRVGLGTTFVISLPIPLDPELGNKGNV